MEANGLAQAAPIGPTAAKPATPALAKPTDITMGLESSGAILLRWKAINAEPNAGTFVSIKRKLSGEAAFVLVGDTGGKMFPDDISTQGTAGAVYII